MELYNFACQADPELEAIRQRRMQELMAQRGGVRYQAA